MEEDILNYSPTVMFRGTPCNLGLFIVSKNVLNTKQKVHDSVFSIFYMGQFKVFFDQRKSAILHF